MIILIPKRNWAAFLEDIGKRRTEWPARIEVDGKKNRLNAAGSGSVLNEITTSESSRGFIVDVSLLLPTESGMHHSIENPVRIVYTVTHGHGGGVIEIQDSSGSTTRIHIEEPQMPFLQKGEERVPMPAVAVV